MFKTPDGFPNAVRASPEGLWVAEQQTLTNPRSGKTNNVRKGPKAVTRTGVGALHPRHLRAHINRFTP